MSIVQQIPALTSSSLTDFVSGLIMAANKGIRVFISASLLDKLRPLFDKLGIQVREAATIPTDTYILIRHAGGIKIKIEVYENGKRVNSISTSIKAFEKALQSIIEKQKGKEEQPSFYELILPEEFNIAGVEAGEEDSDGSSG